MTLKNMQPPESAPSPERLTQFAFGFAPPLLLQTAVELQIFDLIDASPMSLAELSSRTGASVRGLRALLNALVGFEFLRKDDGGRYALAPESEAFLVRNKPAFHGDFFTFVPGMIQHWLNLKEVVKSGKPVVTINSEQEGADFFREFVKSLFNINFAPAMTLAAELKGKREVSSILDLATGSGVWGIVLAEQFRQARVTAVDFPAVLEVTKETAEKHGVADRFRFVGGDLLAVDFGAQHDVAVLGHILHTEGQERSRQLLSKVFASLVAGGTIAIAECS